MPSLQSVYYLDLESYWTGGDMMVQSQVNWIDGRAPTQSTDTICAVGKLLDRIYSEITWLKSAREGTHLKRGIEWLEQWVDSDGKSLLANLLIMMVTVEATDTATFRKMLEVLDAAYEGADMAHSWNVSSEETLHLVFCWAKDVLLEVQDTFARLIKDAPMFDSDPMEWSHANDYLEGQEPILKKYYECDAA